MMFGVTQIKKRLDDVCGDERLIINATIRRFDKVYEYLLW